MRHKYNFACFIWNSWIFFSVFSYLGAAISSSMMECFVSSFIACGGGLICLWYVLKMKLYLYIYNVFCETWQKNSCNVTKNFISAYHLISKIFRYNRYINKTHEKINILNCYFIASNVLLRILSFYSEEMCEM